MPEFIACTPKILPTSLQIDAAQRAIDHNPANRPMIERLPLIMKGFTPTPQSLAVVTSKYWGAKGVSLTVGFLDNPEKALRKLILDQMNAWSKYASVGFRETAGQAQVRIAREADGYWSYLGTDILDPQLPTKQTMNLQGFTVNTPPSEFVRVVRHETGHTLGCPHEHMRKQLVNRIDRAKAYAYFLKTQGWSKTMVDQQVLTALEESSLIGTTNDDETSIMCYQMPGAITKDGKPIIGGVDIDPVDRVFIGKIYPLKKPAKKAAAPPKKRATRAKAKKATRSARRA